MRGREARDKWSASRKHPNTENGTTDTPSPEASSEHGFEHYYLSHIVLRPSTLWVPFRPDSILRSFFFPFSLYSAHKQNHSARTHAHGPLINPVLLCVTPLRHIGSVGVKSGILTSWLNTRTVSMLVASIVDATMNDFSRTGGATHGKRKLNHKLLRNEGSCCHQSGADFAHGTRTTDLRQVLWYASGQRSFRFFLAFPRWRLALGTQHHHRNYLLTTRGERGRTVFLPSAAEHRISQNGYLVNGTHTRTVRKIDESMKPDCQTIPCTVKAGID